PSAGQAGRRAPSSRSTISSRTTIPLPKVTTLASASRRVSTTKPGTSRVWSAPTSRTTAHTCSALTSSGISLRIDAMVPSPRRSGQSSQEDVTPNRPVCESADGAIDSPAMDQPVRYPDPAFQIVDPSFAKYRIGNAGVERLTTGYRGGGGPVGFGAAPR